MNRVTAAQQIRRYEGPQWLVEPLSDFTLNADVDRLNRYGYEVLDRAIRGWGEYNAIVRYEDPDGNAWDYLAHIADD